MLSSRLTVGVVCYSWTNNPGWGLKVELRSCCGSECHTCDPPTLSGIFALWSPAQSCCCRRTKVLLDLCRENLVMTEQTGRRMKVNKGKTGMKKGEGACFPRWSLPRWSDRGWFLHSVAVFRILLSPSVYLSLLFLFVLFEKWKHLKRKQTEKRPRNLWMLCCEYDSGRICFEY